jgi:hypothetical protein
VPGRGLLFLVAVLAGGCRPEWKYVSERAYARELGERELSCELDDEHVRFTGTRRVFDPELRDWYDGPTFEVEGCGHVRTYQCRFYQ